MEIMTTTAFKSELNKAQRIINTLKRMCDGTPVVRNHTVVVPELEATRDEIVRLAASEFCVDQDRVLGDCRTAILTTARHVAIYLTQIKTPHVTIAMLGELFGRDHSSISHAITTIKNRMETEPQLKARIDKLKGMMQ